MLNTCPSCGAYRPDKLIDSAGPFAVCPECGHKQPFKQLPLFIVSGASGAGKSAVCQTLMGRQRHVVPLDGDILWRAEFDTPGTGHRDFFETWLRLAKNIGQSGRPVALFNAGAGVPSNIEPCVERRYFSAVHYLALVCDEAVLVQRLSQRPAWRGSGTAENINAQLRFNQWFMDYGEAEPAITRVDTSRATITATAAQVTDWVNARLGGQTRV
jgi:broad-specificity NMP kinase